MANFDANTPQLKVVEKLYHAYTSRDLTQAMAHISKNHQFQTFPKTKELPNETREGFVQKYGRMMDLLTKVEITFHEMIDAPGKVVFHATTVITTVDGTTIDYDSLTILSFVEEDGELKVLECKDFSDPQKRTNLHVWAAKALAREGHAA